MKDIWTGYGGRTCNREWIDRRIAGIGIENDAGIISEAVAAVVAVAVAAAAVAIGGGEKEIEDFED
ncbi:hypothetical protein C1646_760566 [Rhizophagus diaphanus]|nr:hypothetical protein C1646_760566 [Rhizophagus diaphanus] [Rhizophagus sp. MUCL 43196]